MSYLAFLIFLILPPLKDNLVSFQNCLKYMSIGKDLVVTIEKSEQQNFLGRPKNFYYSLYYIYSVLTKYMI